MHDYRKSDDDMPLPASRPRRVVKPMARGKDFESTLTRRSTRLRSQHPAQGSSSVASSPTQRLVAVEIPSPAQGLSNLASPETSGDEDDAIVTMPASRRRKPAQHGTFVVDDDRVEYISSEDEPVQKHSLRPRRHVGDDFVVSNDEVEYITSENDDELIRPAKARKLSRKHKSPRTPRQRTQREQDELNEDLADLHDSDQDEVIEKPRTRGGPVTTQRDKTREHLELLRRRRAGEKIPRICESGDDEEKDDQDGVDLSFIGQPGFQSVEEDSVHSSVDTENEAETVPDNEEDDFVVEDSQDRLGRPHSGIPLQFTAFASKKPKELFVHVIEWLVKNRIAPAFSREDEIYNLSWARVDDQVQAQAGSRLISAAWNGTFKYSILARPSMRVSALPGEDEDNIRTCDACNRTNHPARYDFIFEGQAYSQKTLEPIDNSEDEEEYNGDVDYDEQGHQLAPQGRHFYLGRFCAANAEMGHKLTHWKYHLNESLMAYLEEQGVLSAEAIVAREKLNKKMREKEAEAIVDNMEETGMIAAFWSNFKNDLEDARLGMEGYERKGGRSKGRIGSVRTRDEHGTVREWKGDKLRTLPRMGSDSEGD